MKAEFCEDGFHRKSIHSYLVTKCHCMQQVACLVSCDTLRAGGGGGAASSSSAGHSIPQHSTTRSRHTLRPAASRAKLGRLRYIELEHTEGEG